MGFLKGLFKPKIVKEIYGGAWGHLVRDHNITVDVLSKEMRCVDKPGVIDDNKPATLIRVFRLIDLKNKGIKVTGWETFNQYPELILFEGYLTLNNVAHLERKKA